jgi:hypothetical protein
LGVVVEVVVLVEAPSLAAVVVEAVGWLCITAIRLSLLGLYRLAVVGLGAQALQLPLRLVAIRL